MWSHVEHVAEVADVVVLALLSVSEIDQFSYLERALPRIISEQILGLVFLRRKIQAYALEDVSCTRDLLADASTGADARATYLHALVRHIVDVCASAHCVTCVYNMNIYAYTSVRAHTHDL